MYSEAYAISSDSIQTEYFYNQILNYYDLKKKFTFIFHYSREKKSLKGGRSQNI